MEQNLGPQAHIVVSVEYNPEDVNKITQKVAPIRGANAATSHASLTSGTPIFRFSSPDGSQSIVSAYVNGIPNDWKMESLGVVYRGSDPHIGVGNDKLIALQPSGSATVENKTSQTIYPGDLVGFIKPQTQSSSSSLTTPEMIVLSALYSEAQLSYLRGMIVQHGHNLNFEYLMSSMASNFGDEITYAILEKLNISRILELSWILGVKFGVLKPTLPFLAAVTDPSTYRGGLDESTIAGFTEELAKSTEDSTGALFETFFVRQGKIAKTAATHGVSGSNEYVQDCARFFAHLTDLVPADQQMFKGNLVGAFTALLYPNSVDSNRGQPTLNAVLNYPDTNSSEGFSKVVKLMGSPAAEESVALELQKATARSSFGIALTEAAPGAPVVVVLSK